MKKILLVTGNKEKEKQIKNWLAELDPSIIIEARNIDTPEEQTLDVRKIALQKARDAWHELKSPVLVDDVGLYLEKYNKFPGTLTKYVYEGIGLEGIQTLARDNQAAYFLCCLVYMDSPDSYHFFEGILKGKIMLESCSIKNPEAPYPPIFKPLGSDKTLDLLRGTAEEKLYHHRYKALVKLVDWLQARNK